MSFQGLVQRGLAERLPAEKSPSKRISAGAIGFRLANYAIILVNSFSEKVSSSVQYFTTGAAV